MRFAALVFDLDGTLLDSQDLIAQTVNRVLAERGHQPVDPAAVHVMMGLPLEDIYQAFLPAAAQHQLAACLQAHREVFMRDMVPRARPLPGAAEAVAALAADGRRMAVATNRLTGTAAAMLEHCGLAGHFEAIHGVDLVERPKPFPDLLLHTLTVLGGLPPEQVLVVGDSGADVAMALAAGAPVCAVTWGAQPRSALLELEPTWCVDRWQELLDLLQSEA